MRASTRLKIASASLNQTVYDFATNVPNILAAIDRAVADGADILSLEELALTGYAADDYHQWHKSNDAIWPYIEVIANYANEKNPNLVISLGTPWHYADKKRPASDAAYNINNRPFNTQMTIMGGRVVGISAKSILADGAAEYEPRQFNHWPLSKGTITINLPDGSEVPFGKPVVMFGDGHGNRITLAHEICAEGWPGVHDDLSIDDREQREARNLIELAKDHDISVVLNPSASKPQPAINKENIRAEGLCKTGSKYCGVFVYTNYLGSSSGNYAAEGSRIFAQNEKIMHHGNRYSFQDVSYSSVVVDLPPVRKTVPDASLHRDFAAHLDLTSTGPEAAFDAAHKSGAITTQQLVYEEYMRSIALWLRDYMAKPGRGTQGYVISLSGGKDSAYGAVAIAAMIELDIRENGVEGFLARFKRLAFKDAALAALREKGEDAAIKIIKNGLITCVYLPTENSSDHTLNAARFMVEGGILPDGGVVDGIGGKFYIAPVQSMLDEATIAFTGLNLERVVKDNLDTILDGQFTALSAGDRCTLARGRVMQMIKRHVNAVPGTNPQLPDYLSKNWVNRIPTWANASDDTTLQNIQARTRLPIPWTIANQEHKMPLVTSNESEAVHSYTTAGGDMHMGGANPIGGMPKHAITKSLEYFEAHGLVGFAPIKSLYWINHEKPSAELRKVVEGAPQQTDENDLGFSYEQSEFIEKRLIVGRQLPIDVLAQMRESSIFPQDIAAQREILLGFARRWESGQFKRIMAPLAPHVGSNVDPHQSVRTTVLGDHFHTSCACMSLAILAEVTGMDGFQEKFGLTLAQANVLAGLNAPFKSALINWKLDDLLNADKWAVFDRGILKYAGEAKKAGDAFKSSPASLRVCRP